MILLITDNYEIFQRFVESNHSDNIHYYHSPNNNDSRFSGLKKIDVKQEVSYIIIKYDLVISLHCKQIFPPELVNGVRCVNVHPGLNPYSRGMYPQIFSIINELPCGATIHEMSEDIDAGPIICQKKIEMESYDDSLSAYTKIIEAEFDLLSEWWERIVNNDYKTTVPKYGDYNSKKDFERLCELDVYDCDTFIAHINHLRALTHGDYANAYFYDDKGRKIKIKVTLKLEK